MNIMNLIEEFKQKLIVYCAQDEAFKRELINNTKESLSKKGIALPEGIELKVVEETSNSFYLVLPPKSSQEELSEQDLELVAGGRNIIDQLIDLIETVTHFCQNT